MLFRQLFDCESCTYTYLIAKAKGSDAIIIDPVKSKIDSYIKLIDELGLKLIAALDTHLHADHITATGLLKERLGCQVMMGQQTLAQDVMPLHHNQVLTFDGFSIKVLYTPGHTDDSYCFLMADRVFTGDTLFIRGTGRTDFQNGDAGQQYRSITQILLQLPKETLIYPGHDYNGMTVSTVEEELRFNPRLQVDSEEAYVKLMSGLNLPKPKLIDIAVPLNKNCGMESALTHQ